MTEEIKTWEQIHALAKEVEFAAAEAWAEELDSLDMSKDANQGGLEDFFGVNDYWAEDFENSFQWIRDYMLEASGANPEQFGPMISQLEAAAKTIKTDKILDIKSDIADRTIQWQGEGASSFQEFLKPTWEAATNQLLLINALHVNLSSYRKVLIEARKNVYEIGTETKNALEEISYGGSINTSAVLTVINLVKTGTLAAIEVSNTPLSVGVAIADGIWTEVKGAVPNEPESDGEHEDESTEYNIGGETVAEVLDALSLALSDVKKTVDEKEQIIADKLQEAYDFIDSEGRESFEAPRPTIAGASASELKSMDDGLGWHD